MISETKPKLPRAFRVVEAVGRVTFFEILKDKVLYNIFLCAFLLFGVSWLASRLTVIRPERIVLDFGLSAVTLSCAAIAVLTGASLISRELDRRTIQVALSRPISRAQFIVGKFMGLSAILGLNWFLLSISYLALLGLGSDEGRALISLTLIMALILILVQSIFLASIAILVSTLSTASLTVIVSLGLYLVGNTISQLRMIAVRFRSVYGRYFMNSVASLLPNFEYFNLGTQVTYGLPISWQYMGLTIFYGLIMITIALGLAGLLIEVREV